MKKYDPDFDIEELLYEAEEIFKEFYCNYLTGNQDYLDLVCGSTASGLVKSSIELRVKEGWTYKYDELLNCGPCFFMGGQIADNIPMFTYHIEVQEFDSKIWKSGKEPEKVEKDGGLMQNTYRIVLARHDEPDMEVTGHYWQIVEFYRIGEVRMLA